MPGAELASRNHGVPSASTMRSERERSRSPSAWWASRATSAHRAAAAASRRAGAKNSVAPAV